MPKTKKTNKKYKIDKNPIVTMLGHVDHGKTSLLDAIRGTKVQCGEAGGITQSVRAHKIDYKTKNNDVYTITFIDTPGHKAFSQMRSRGAHVTDIVVLVVAADDGVQPQTIEAIKFAKEAKVPIIVALNKIDLPDIDKSKILRELADQKVQVEKLGGEVIYVETSAKKNKGLDDLLEAVLLTAEINSLKERKPKKGIAEAVVLESTKDNFLGSINFCLIKSGSINIDAVYSFEDQHKKIRAIKDENFCNVKEAKTSDPVWIAGFEKEIPVGSTIFFYNDPKDIKVKKVKPQESIEEKPSEDIELDEEILSQLIESQSREEKSELNIILKSESQGTLEVAQKEIQKLGNDETSINIIEKGTGDISEDDIIKAKNSHGIVIGFKSYLPKKNERISRIEKVLVKNYEIIYELLEEIAEVIDSMKEPVMTKVEVARAKIKKVFTLSDGSRVAGCTVIKGTVLKGYQCFIERPGKNKNKVLGEAKIISLKCRKEEVREAGKGTECGILLNENIEFEKDDEIVCFKLEKD